MRKFTSVENQNGNEGDNYPRGFYLGNLIRGCAAASSSSSSHPLSHLHKFLHTFLISPTLGDPQSKHCVYSGYQCEKLNASFLFLPVLIDWWQKEHPHRFWFRVITRVFVLQLVIIKSGVTARTSWWSGTWRWTAGVTSNRPVTREVRCR